MVITGGSTLVEGRLATEDLEDLKIGQELILRIGEGKSLLVAKVIVEFTEKIGCQVKIIEILERGELADYKVGEEIEATFFELFCPIECPDESDAMFEILEKTVDSLANLKKPDFSKFERADVLTTFKWMWSGDVISPAILDTLEKRILEASDGKVRLILKTDNIFLNQSPRVAYLKLVKNGVKTQCLLIRPTEDPIVFVNC